MLSADSMATTVLGGWIEANATLVGVVIVATAVIAVIHVVRRLVRDSGSD